MRSFWRTFRGPRRLRQLGHQALQTAVGRVLDLQTVAEQGPVHCHGPPQDRAVFLQVPQAHPPVLAQVPVRLLRQGHVRKQVIPHLGVGQFVLHAPHSFPRLSCAHTV